MSQDATQITITMRFCDLVKDTLRELLGNNPGPIFIRMHDGFFSADEAQSTKVDGKTILYSHNRSIGKCYWCLTEQTRRSFTKQ